MSHRALVKNQDNKSIKLITNQQFETGGLLPDQVSRQKRQKLL